LRQFQLFLRDSELRGLNPAAELTRANICHDGGKLRLVHLEKPDRELVIIDLSVRSRRHEIAQEALTAISPDALTDRIAQQHELFGKIGVGGILRRSLREKRNGHVTSSPR